MENNDEALVLTPREAMKILRCSRSVMYSCLKNGSIPSIRISPRKILIPKQRFLEWLNGGGGNHLHQKDEENTTIESGAY